MKDNSIKTGIYCLDHSPIPSHACGRFTISFLKAQTKATICRAENFATCFAVSCLLTVGCVTARAPFPKVTDPNKRYEFNDFSAKVPRGTDWLIHESGPGRNSAEIVFFKDFHYKRYPATHSFYVSARSDAVTNVFANPNAFLTFAQQWCATANPARFKPFEPECRLDRRFGDYCVKFHLKSQDYGAHVGGTVLIMDMQGYLFRHPQATNHVIIVFWSERGRPDELDQSLNDAGESFVSDLQLRP